MRLTQIRHEFVSFAPDVLQAGVVYVALEYGTVLHLCCCGCGNQVVTPLSPARWGLWFDGESISLSPSIGNWSFPCRSHYWIEHSEVLWDRPFSDAEVAGVRGRDRRAIEHHLVRDTPHAASSVESAPRSGRERLTKWWQRWRSRWTD